MSKTSVDLNEVNMIQYTNSKMNIIWLNKKTKFMEMITRDKSICDGTVPIYLERTTVHTHRVLILYHSHEVKIHQSGHSLIKYTAL
jgi:hypothetical protein